MRILVILRQVFEQKSIQWDYTNDRFIYEKEVFNQADLSALYWASEYAKKAEAALDILILQKSTNHFEEKKLAHLMIQRCFQVPSNGVEREDAAFIADLLKDQFYQLILTGMETEDEHSSALLPLLAYQLDMDMLTGAHQLVVQSNGKLGAFRKEERGSVQEFTIQFPIAISVTSQIAKQKYTRERQTAHFDVIEVKRQLPSIPRRQIRAPEPNIWCSEAPAEEIAQLRLLNIMGFSQQSNDTDSMKKQTDRLSDKHLHFTAERLIKWLKE